MTSGGKLSFSATGCVDWLCLQKMFTPPPSYARKNNLSGIDIRDSQVIEECILFGFPLNNDVMHVLKFCILYANYYIYIQRLFNYNTLDLYVCLTQLKQALEIEENICRKKNEDNFFKFHFIYEKL